MLAEVLKLSAGLGERPEDTRGPTGGKHGVSSVKVCVARSGVESCRFVWSAVILPILFLKSTTNALKTTIIGS